MDATLVVNRGDFGSIICCSGALLGKRFDIPLHGLTMGRHPDSDVVVNDPRVSVQHAQIRPKQGKVVVVDAESANGIFLNDFQSRVVGESVLKPGDVIMLSATDAAQFIYRK
jgi:pSer/pThr/pTyr-binding forkhead associated (FHA) protein